MRIHMDFETRSECDITTEGAWKYSQHSSTDVMCLAYAVDDKPAKMWIPPKHAVRYIFNVRAKHKGLMGHFSRVKGKAKKVTKKMQDEYATKTPFEWGGSYNILEAKKVNRGWNWDGDLVLPVWSRYRIKSKPDFLSLINTVTDLEFEAHNAFFEKSMWENVCVPKYGFPKLEDTSWSCSAALAATRALPRALDKVGETLALPIQKNHDGKLVMMQLSRPGQDGKFNSDPLKLSILYSYCLDDVRAEREISRKLGHMSEYERRVWLLDQKINKKGVPLDNELIEGAIKIIETYTKVLEDEMSTVTGGRLNNIRQTAALQMWLEENGVLVDNVQKGTVEEILQRPNLPDNVRRVLEIRRALGQTSTSKYYAMKSFLSEDHTAKDQFLYSGASTLRWSGKGIQFQNLPRGTLKATEEMYSAIKSGSWRVVRLYGDVMDVLASCLRGVATAELDMTFIDSDFSNIEGRILAWVAKEAWKVKAFDDFDNGVGEDLYNVAYGKAFHKPATEVDKDERQIGKTLELACFGPDTQVLTNSGYKYIIDIKETDLLWDGVEWVSNGGVINKGKKETILLDGVSVTPEHKVLVNESWMSAQMVVSNPTFLCQALETFTDNLPLLKWLENQREVLKESKSSALAGQSRILFRYPIYGKGLQQDVTLVQKRNPESGKRTSMPTKILFLIRRIAEDFSTGYQLVSGDVKTTPRETETMPEEGLKFKKSGQKVQKAGGFFSSILRHLRGGITRRSIWTESTTTEIMKKGTSDLSHKKRTITTEEQFKNLKKELKSLNPVFDILNSGPRNRFTIKTDSGHMIVHNCGYQGSIGAFHNMAKTLGVQVTDERAKELVDLWRESNPMIAAFWPAMETAAKKAIATGEEIRVNEYVSFVVVNDFLEMRTIAGSTLYYYQPRLEEVETRFGSKKLAVTFTGVNSVTRKTERQSTYGGKLTENLVQHLARMVLCDAMLRLDDHGFDIRMHVHDQVVSQVPENDNVLNVELYDTIMQTTPDWCPDLPLAAKGEVIKRFKKG